MIYAGMLKTQSVDSIHPGAFRNHISETSFDPPEFRDSEEYENRIQELQRRLEMRLPLTNNLAPLPRE